MFPKHRIVVTLFLFACGVNGSLAQNYSAFTAPINALLSYAAIPDTTSRNTKVEAWWRALQESHHIPFIVEDSVAFLYRGKANAVDWMGDFNAWGYLKEFKNKGKLIRGTDIWLLKTAFPKNARLDYKIMLNGNTWVLDPENPVQQWSGVGGGSPNSELCMPDWKEDPILIARDNIPHGKLEQEILFNSKILGYQITYSVYFPAELAKGTKYQSLYVTDGYEYLHPKMGNMVVVLDNLIADKKIKPVIAIFIDQRDPVNRSNNRRMEELAMNPKYLDFFSKEFIPHIQSTCPVLPLDSDRAIMGSSMGGLNAAYFAFSQPGIFGMAGIQSPAFNMRPQIYNYCNNPDRPIKVSMTSGSISDASEGSKKMQEILKSNACVYSYHEVNEGHSWGNWRNLIDDILIDLFGK